MPNWKRVPSLKTIALRRLAWPDAIYKALHLRKAPTVETYVRDTLIRQYFDEKRAEEKENRRRNIHTPKESVRSITENVIGAWIKLSNFYETRLSEIGGMSMFMEMSTIGTLDFLHEGFTLQTEKDFLRNIFPYIGVVPYSIKPQTIDFRTWLDLVNVMVVEGVCDTLYNIYIPFGNEKLRSDKFPFRHDPTPATFRFDDTFVYFINLRRIVVRGDVGDELMLALGENCLFLEHLDVRGTHITDRGLMFLLFRKLGKRFFKGTFLPAYSRFPFYPNEILQPCCATLRYLDVSGLLTDPQSTEANHACDLCVSRACPQLRLTPLRFYFSVPGQTRVVLSSFTDGVGLTNFRQDLVNYVRQSYCERLFEFVQLLLTSIYFDEPSLEVIENDLGEETAFLFLSGSAIMIQCEIENLTVLTLVSFMRNILTFIPISLISRFAPKLQKLKACLKGTLSGETAMKSLKYLCAPMIQDVDTMESILEHCSELEYLEVRGIFAVDTAKYFGEEQVQQIFHRDPGEYAHLEVLRLLFPNQIPLYPGLSWIAVRCPSLTIVGDLSGWAIPFDTLMRIHANTSFYNYEFALEFDGVLHYCDNKNKLDLTRFE